MKYISTRGNAPAKTFTEILLGGLAPDGGLYLPEQYPQVTRAELDAWRKLSYADLAFAVLSKFATDIPAADLKAIVSKTYTAEVYSNGHEIVVPELLVGDVDVDLDVAAHDPERLPLGELPA